MHWLLGALSGIAFVEILLRLPFFADLRRFGQIVTRVMAVIRSSRISDHWKERILPRYAAQMMGKTLRLGGILLMAFAPLAVLSWIAGLMGVPLMAFSLSWVGIIFISVVAFGYAKLRMSRVAL